MGFAAAFRLASDSEDGDSFCVVILFVPSVVVNFTITSWTAEVGEIAQTCETMVFYFRYSKNYYFMVFVVFLGIIHGVKAEE